MTDGYPPDPPLPAPSAPDHGNPYFMPGTPEYERMQAALARATQPVGASATDNRPI